MYDTTQAVNCLSSVFLNLLKTEFPTLAGFEDEAKRIGNEVIAHAMGHALSLLDSELCSNLPKGIHIHERRKRTLATCVGDVCFTRRLCRDRYNNTVVPLDEAIDLCRGARVSPAAMDFLVDAGAEVSYAKAAALLTRAGGSHVSAKYVMGALQKCGEACEQADVRLAHELYVNGVVPDADVKEDEICLEADGTYVALQTGGKVEVKAMVAYAHKSHEGNKTRRVYPVRFGCVSTPQGFWTQGMAALGTRFDLSSIKICHTGFDGEAQYKAAGTYLRTDATIDANLDAFHVNRSVAACFEKGSDAYHQVMDCLWLRHANEAADLLEEYEKVGTANGHTSRVAAYLRNNSEFIKCGSISLGTMEAEQEHLYKSRMSSVPCAWSIRGVNNMARIRSRKYSGRLVPKPTRESTLSAKRKRAREKRIEKSLVKNYRIPPHTVGSGYEYPHNATLSHMRADIRYNAGLYRDRWVRESDPQ